MALGWSLGPLSWPPRVPVDSKMMPRSLHSLSLSLCVYLFLYPQKRKELYSQTFLVILFSFHVHAMEDSRVDTHPNHKNLLES